MTKEGVKLKKKVLQGAKVDWQISSLLMSADRPISLVGALNHWECLCRGGHVLVRATMTVDTAPFAFPCWHDCIAGMEWVSV